MSGLYDVYGESLKKCIQAMKRQAKEEKQSKRRSCGRDLESQIETGTPYMLYKDAVNHKSNQKNLGTIRSSNLCTEIMEYTSLMRLLCNLASLSLPMFVENGKFDHQALYDNN
jgi:ribonucleoside-diphosphate reductase alpha chain